MRWLVNGLALLAAAGMLRAADPVRFANTGHTDYGDWSAEATVSPASWDPAMRVHFEGTLDLAEAHIAGLAGARIKADSVCVLVTAERTFDAGGWLRLPSDERMSTLVTPTGLPIEGGVQGAISKRTGYSFATPLDELLKQKLTETVRGAGRLKASFQADATLPDSLPPGIYRLRLDYGVLVGTRMYSLNGGAFAHRPPATEANTQSFMYSPPFRAGGMDVSGHPVEGASIRPRIPWTLMGRYNSNGYRGVVADEDQGRFAVASRVLIQDDVILPLYNGNRKIAYSLEPQFPADAIEARQNVPWDFTQGELAIEITDPAGKVRSLGTASIVGSSGGAPTTRRQAFTAWVPPQYGYYTVKTTGWIADQWGNRYEGGGTYHFWIANRMTMATATFQGMAYPVGSKYGRDMSFAPAVPADVDVHAVLYVNSDPTNRREVKSSGKASPFGVFGVAQGLQQLTLDAPGEYYAHVLAKYTDPAGNLWVSSMRHAGVVYPADSPIVAHGKKLRIGGQYVDRGETHDEGWTDADGTQHLMHINFPYQSGDVLLIAAEGEASNKIEPVLTYEIRAAPAPYDPRLQNIGTTNLRLMTSNGYSPHLYPEYITDWAYYYGSGARPGFMGRFLVSEDGAKAPYWPTSPNAFGSQINASPNGDSPGDIYRLIGGVVLKKKGQQPLYAGYLASAFILPKGSNNNRVIEAGSEELTGSTGEKSRVFLVGLRPGMTYETGTSFAPAVQIDPILPANVSFALDYPDGRHVTQSGTGDQFGTFAGATRWTLDVAGIYRYHLDAEWQGYKAIMPGLPASGGEFYVVEKDRPADAGGITLDLKETTTFPADGGLTIAGNSTAQSVYYAAVMPGAVLGQGTLTVTNGKFQFYLDPKEMNRKAPTYDIVNHTTGAPDMKDVIHLTFFSEEKTAAGVTYHSFARVIFRGNTAIYTK